jgi:hypothetical protein
MSAQAHRLWPKIILRGILFDADAMKHLFTGEDAMVLNYTYERKPWPAQLVDMYQFDNSWTRLRLIGGTSTYYQFWLQLNRGGRIVSVEKICVCCDSENGMRTCPYCEANLKGKRMVLANAIIRKLQRTPSTTIGGLTENEKNSS